MNTHIYITKDSVQNMKCVVFTLLTFFSLALFTSADIVPQFPGTNGLYTCPPQISNVFGELLYVTDSGADGPGTLPNGHKYCRYLGNAGGDAIYASYDRATGHGVMFGSVMHGTPAGGWITHDRNHSGDEALQLPYVASSKCNVASWDWYVNMGLCSDRSFIGVFLKSELDAMGYTPFTVFAGDIGIAPLCTYGADWLSATCSDLTGH